MASQARALHPPFALRVEKPKESCGVGCGKLSAPLCEGLTERGGVERGAQQPAEAGALTEPAGAQAAADGLQDHCRARGAGAQGDGTCE